MALRLDGRVVIWGHSDYVLVSSYEPVNLSISRVIPSVYFKGYIGISSTGEIIYWGKNRRDLIF